MKKKVRYLAILSIIILAGIFYREYFLKEYVQFRWEETGDKILLETYYDNGNIESKINCNKDTIFEGESIFYYPNGNKEVEYYYQDGKRNGPVNAYFESGNLKYTGRHKADSQDSIWHWYKEKDGKSYLETIESYSKGKLLGGQIQYYPDENIKSYKFYHFDGLYGVITFDSLLRSYTIKGQFDFIIYNKKSLNQREEFSSIIYLGVPPSWTSKIKVTIVNAKDELVADENCKLEKHRVSNTDKYFFNCASLEIGQYLVKYDAMIFDDDGKLIYKDVIDLSIDITP